jgi:hypothetical protein
VDEKSHTRHTHPVQTRPQRDVFAAGVLGTVPGVAYRDLGV